MALEEARLRDDDADGGPVRLLLDHLHGALEDELHEVRRVLEALQLLEHLEKHGERVNKTLLDSI